ncbi:MAG: type II toxin-antitoxin system MqsA family antitoxin [Paracoccaceae bacterium]|nr:type II toxin-antitoxin system MqsA family antitoxin [Paracoccaceae bacterium]
MSAKAPETREPHAAPAEGEAARCTACAGGVLARESVNTAFWQGEQLVVVEGIPALVCQSCGEQFYEDETAMKLDLMRGRGFRDAKAVRKIDVPVFAFEAAAPASEKG